MASELSESVWNKWTVTGDLRELIDAELQETRAVLILTADRNILPHGPCWCRKDLTNDAEPHDEFCQRARALWAKLEIKQ